MSAPPPFGKPFKYTDAYDLETQLDRAKPWWKRWFSRRPKAWQVIGAERPTLPVAYIMHDKQEPKQSEVIAPSVLPIYNADQAILEADEYERTHPSVDGGNNV